MDDQHCSCREHDARTCCRITVTECRIRRAQCIECNRLSGRLSTVCLKGIDGSLVDGLGSFVSHGLRSDLGLRLRRTFHEEYRLMLFRWPVLQSELSKVDKRGN